MVSIENLSGVASTACRNVLKINNNEKDIVDI